MSEIQVDRVVCDRYLVRHTLGAGLQGKVKLAVSRVDGSLCALKVLNNNSFTATDLAALDKEIRALRSVQHPNIVALKVNAMAVD